ncbi:MAG: hypothetical protein IJM78_03600 [Prevotella sp.]|nr:hypothetical protein [Prevotella sp.]
MKKLVLTIITLMTFTGGVNAQNVEQVGSGDVRQLCVGEGNRAYHKVNAKFCYYKPGGAVAAGRKVKAWVDDRDATLWGHNVTDIDNIVVYVKFVDKKGQEHKIYPRLPKGTLPNHNARKLADNASYVIEVGWGR